MSRHPIEVYLGLGASLTELVSSLQQREAFGRVETVVLHGQFYYPKTLYRCMHSYDIAQV